MIIRYPFILIFLVVHIYSYGQRISYQHVPRQPYNKYVISDDAGKDSISFYLSEFSPGSALPLLIYVQGSGNSSLFSKDGTGRISPTSGHITWAYATKDKAKLLIIEKPGVHFLDPGGENCEFDKKFSLENWAARIREVIRFVITHEKIDTSRIMIAGHSEGGLVAARVAKDLDNLVTHVSILAGEGPSQLYSLYSFAEAGVFFDSPQSTPAQRIDSLTRTWKKILAAPHSTQQKFWGFTYLRWSSFLQTSVAAELSHYDGKVLILQGDQDNNVLPESAKVLYTTLLSEGKHVTLEMIPGADHSFNIKGHPEINGWEMVIRKSISQFLEK